MLDLLEAPLMAGLKHDAHKCREDAKSTRIRAAHGIKYPHETQAEQERAEAQRLERLKAQAKGLPLGLE